MKNCILIDIYDTVLAQIGIGGDNHCGEARANQLAKNHVIHRLRVEFCDQSLDDIYTKI